MKTAQPHQTLSRTIVVIIVLLPTIAMWLFIPGVHAALSIYWLVLISLIILALTPYGSIRLRAATDTNPHYGPKSWLLRIFTLELSLIAIFYGICYIAGHATPVLTKPQPALFTDTLYYLCIHLGLFPFTTFALIAITMNYVSYQACQDAHFSTLLYPLVKTYPNQPLGLTINKSMHSLNMYAIASSITFVTLGLIAIVVPHSALLGFVGFKPITLVTVFIVVALILNKRFNRHIYTLVIKKQRSPMTIMLGFSLVSAVAIIVLILFFGTQGKTALQLPTLIVALLKHGWKIPWEIFTMSWWLTWAPIGGMYIAKISRGYKLRSVLLATLALPCGITLLTIICHIFRLVPHDSILVKLAGFILPIIGLVIILAMITEKSIFSMIIQIYLPKLDRIKIRGQDQFIGKVLQFSAFILYAYIAAGIAMLCLLFFIFVLIPSLTLLLLPLALFKRLWQTQHQKNRPRIN